MVVGVDHWFICRNFGSLEISSFGISFVFLMGIQQSFFLRGIDILNARSLGAPQNQIPESFLLS